MPNKNAAALIKALQIADKYLDDYQRFTHCEHDELFLAIDADKVSDADKAELDELGFTETDEIFHSFQHGSC